MSRSARAPFALGPVAIVAVAGALLGLYYFLAIDVVSLDYSLGLQTAIVDGDAFSPYRYRVLSPFLLDALIRRFSLSLPPYFAFVPALAVFDIAGYAFQFISLYVLLRRWFPAARSVAACVFIGTVAHVTFAYFRYHPWSILEVAFMALGLAAAHAGRFRLLGLVVILASLNRETGVFLPIACFAGAFWTVKAAGIPAALRNRQLWLLGSYVLLSVAIFATLRQVRGAIPQVDLLSDIFALNLSVDNRPRAAWGIALMLGAGWPLAVVGLRRAPAFLRGATWVVLPYLAVFLIWGTWREMRLLTTLYPVLLPLIAFTLSPRPAAQSVDASWTPPRRRAADAGTMTRAEIRSEAVPRV